MGTANFSIKNASKVFAVLTSYEQPVLDDDGNETDEMETVQPEDWEYEDLKENLRDVLIKKGYRKDNSVDNERQYTGVCIAEKWESNSWGDREICVTIKAIIRSAYYEGASLDWEIEFNTDWTDDEIDFADYFEDSDMNKGLQSIHLRNAEKWAEATKERFVKELEEVFAQWSTPLQVAARFSNGETWYKEAV